MTNSGEKIRRHGPESAQGGEKSKFVHSVFSSVSSKYDLMNDAMSFGLHRLWKDALIDWLAPSLDRNLLDVAGGTGDVAFRYLERCPGGSAIVLDLTEKMVARGRSRASALKLKGKLDWVVGDAMALPFPSDSFDACTVSFGIRNVPDIRASLGEMRRVLRFGGRILVLEFSRVRPAGLRSVYDLYSRKVIPSLGEAVARDRESYQYLIDSIRRFPDQEEFAGMVRGAGFANVRHRNLTFGVAAIHSGWKL